MQLFFKGNILLQMMFYLVLLATIWTNINIRLALIFCVCIVLYVPILRYIDKTAGFIILFSCSYCLILLFHNIDNLANFISYLVCPTLFYCYGRYIVDKTGGDINNITIFLCFSVLLFSFVLHISAILDILQNGFINTTRTFPIWGSVSGRGTLSATIYGLVASLGLVGLPLFFVKTKLKPIIKFTFLLIAVLSLITVIHLINRTGIIVLLLCLAAIIFYKNNGNIFQLIIICSVIFVIIILLLHFQIINQDISNAYLERNEGISSVDTAGGRTDKWIIGINNLFRYPFGWSEEKLQYGYAHNMWIDIARVSGILPFAFFCIATILSYFDLLKLLKYREQTLTPLILGLNVCFFFSSFVEPIIDALPLYLYLYIMLWGMQHQLPYLFNKSYDYNRMEIRR